MNITVLDGYTLNPGDLSWEPLQKLGSLTVYDRTSPEEAWGRSRNADALFTNKVVIDRKLIGSLPQLRFIGVLATGFNVVDTVAAKEAGVVVCNIPAYSTASVAQMVFAHILNFTQRTGMHTRLVSEGEWSRSRDFCFWHTPQTELAGKTLGIIGFGRIGQAVARIGDAFGMKILFHNRSLKSGFPQDYKQVPLTELLGNSDFISINCPLTPENQNFINASTLNLMKPAAFLVNTGRGPLIHEADLAEALNQDRIAGAGLDVMALEPPKPDNPLLTAKNCFITPHIAWATFEARSRLMQMAAGNLSAFMEGKPVNQV